MRALLRKALSFRIVSRQISKLYFVGQNAAYGRDRPGAAAPLLNMRAIRRAIACARARLCHNLCMEIKINARKYEDQDDCLAAAAEDYASENGLEGWDLNPRWEDESREIIVLEVPE